MRRKGAPSIPKTSHIDRTVKFSGRCFLEEDVRILSHVLLGGNVHVASNTTILGPARIGQNSYIGQNCVIGHPPRKELKSVILGEKMKRDLTDIVHVGENCIIRSGCILYSNVTLYDNVELGHNVLIREGVTVGSGTMVGTSTVIDGQSEIGQNVRIQTGVYVSPYTRIEHYVFLGPNCLLLNDKYIMQKDSPLQGPTIKKGASIGGNAVIMPAVTVGEGAVVGAGAVVVRDVEPKTIYVGVPARRLKAVPDEWTTKLGKT